MTKDRKCTHFSTCAHLIYRDNKTGLCASCRHRLSAAQPGTSAPPPDAQVAADRKTQRTQHELLGLRSKYEESLRTIARLETSLSALDGLTTRGVDTFTIAPSAGSGTSEATAVVVASDWHFEERVIAASVSGLNEQNLEISHRKATKFFQSSLRLVRLLQQDVQIKHLVMPLLGDFISNDIHEEFPENNELQPMPAIETVQNVLASGIEFLLQHSKLQFTFPCHSGNHARTTRTTRFASENGHSLEYLMYLHLAAYFRKEPRVTFLIGQGMHSYMDIYDTTVRFQHGHAIKYGGGVGGIYIPVNKAIAQWGKARHADLDVFGHFHQLRDGGNFICNGSLVGYSSFALSIKADFEKPRQALFLLDKRRGRTCLWPIMVD